MRQRPSGAGHRCGRQLVVGGVDRRLDGLLGCLTTRSSAGDGRSNGGIARRVEERRTNRQSRQTTSCSRPGMRSCTAVEPSDPARRHVGQAKTLVRAVNNHRMLDGRQSASQQGMGSLDSRCLIERHGDQCFRWSEPMWSPPPERTGDPILTMEPPGTAVRTALSPGRARPSEPKLLVLFRRSYAFTWVS
jgi:hypothetical protein